MRILTPGKRLKGRVSISRAHGHADTYIHFEIVDDLSGCIVAELEMTPEDFGNAVTGMSMQPCVLEYYADCPAGKRREVKHEVVPVPSAFDRKNAKKFLKNFEVDGWIGSADDIGNHHRYVAGKKGYNVTFVRFVDATE